MITLKFGTAAVWLGLSLAAHGQIFTTLYSFGGYDGAQPSSALVQGTNGELYGTTAGCLPETPCGTVFRISPVGAFTSLYQFCSQPGCADGYNAIAGLALATNGNFYGTTFYGGLHGQYGGTVYEISPQGAFTSLYSFCAETAGTVCTDGQNPMGGLVQATNGYLYGTTTFGGATNSGTIFRIAPAGGLTKLYDFCVQSGCPDGASPSYTLIQGGSGELYGTTPVGEIAVASRLDAEPFSLSARAAV